MPVVPYAGFDPGHCVTDETFDDATTGAIQNYARAMGTSLADTHRALVSLRTSIREMTDKGGAIKFKLRMPAEPHEPPSRRIRVKQPPKQET